MTTGRTIAISIILSIALHLLFFTAVDGVRLSSQFPAAHRRPDYKTQDIQPLRLKLAPQAPREEGSSNENESTLFPAGPEDAPPLPLPGDMASSELPVEVPPPPLDEKSAEVARLLKDADLAEAPVTLYETTIEAARTPAADAETLPTVITAPAPEILEIPAAVLPPERLSLPERRQAAELEREFIPRDVALPSLAAEGPLLTEYPPARVSALTFRSSTPLFGLPALDDPALTAPETALSGAASLLPGTQLAAAVPQLDGSAPDQLSPAVRLDDFVDVNVTVARDPAGSGGCYQVSIRPNHNSSAMAEIPKDVLFIIDRSASISPPKFAQFKRAVAEVIPALSPADRFNVIAFTDKSQPMFSKLVPATPHYQRIASEEVLKIPHGGLTDVFSGLAPYISGDGARHSGRPLNIFLLTDGRSTVNVHEPNIFLKRIVNLNPGNVSVFPFSAGEKTNRLLLDFLGYLNRGRNRHAETLGEVRDSMVRFFTDNNSLLVAGLRCEVISGAPANEIFPRSLPNLCRGENLLIYGRFSNPDSEIVLLLKGVDATGRSRDLLFRRKLSECPAGDTALCRRWAAQKLLYLQARRNSTDNPAETASLERRISALQKQYPEIFIPR